MSNKKNVEKNTILKNLGYLKEGKKSIDKKKYDDFYNYIKDIFEKKKEVIIDNSKEINELIESITDLKEINSTILTIKIVFLLSTCEELFENNQKLIEAQLDIKNFSNDINEGYLIKINTITSMKFILNHEKGKIFLKENKIIQKLFENIKKENIYKKRINRAFQRDHDDKYV
jgi:hypothetical protein